VVRDGVDALVHDLVRDARPGDAILIMSNGGFDGIHDRLLQALATRAGTPIGDH
jgi:UDP-N-acetylmuramate: L-alanyl-gamma-D-glutamyl-meso-diaminopimelate ligase